MAVIETLPPPQSSTWYLAYGSNLNTTKFIHDRGITPLASATVTVPGWTMVMHSAGVPYSEPSFASIQPIPAVADEKCTELVGTAYKLTTDMYKKVLASEGGGIAYREIEVRAELLEQDKESGCHPTFPARTLITVLPRAARPSLRYMTLIRTGAYDSHFPSSYQKFLASIPVYEASDKETAKLGARLFLAFWVPVMSVMEKITKDSLKTSKTGNAPWWIVILVRAVVYSMWCYHDYVHAPIWGRGDGIGM